MGGTTEWERKAVREADLKRCLRSDAHKGTRAHTPKKKKEREKATQITRGEWEGEFVISGERLAD